MKGEFDSKNARVFCGLVPSVDGREMYMYYLGSDTFTAGAATKRTIACSRRRGWPRA